MKIISHFFEIIAKYVIGEIERENKNFIDLFIEEFNNGNLENSLKYYNEYRIINITYNDFKKLDHTIYSIKILRDKFRKPCYSELYTYLANEKIKELFFNGNNISNILKRDIRRISKDTLQQIFTDKRSENIRPYRIDTRYKLDLDITDISTYRRYVNIFNDRRNVMGLIKFLSKNYPHKSSGERYKFGYKFNISEKDFFWALNEIKYTSRVSDNREYVLKFLLSSLVSDLSLKQKYNKLYPLLSQDFFKKCPKELAIDIMMKIENRKSKYLILKNCLKNCSKEYRYKIMSACKEFTEDEFYLPIIKSYIKLNADEVIKYLL